MHSHTLIMKIARSAQRESMVKEQQVKLVTFALWENIPMIQDIPFVALATEMLSHSIQVQLLLMHVSAIRTTTNASIVQST
jgi:hypothetical protein